MVFTVVDTCFSFEYGQKSSGACLNFSRKADERMREKPKVIFQPPVAAQIVRHLGPCTGCNRDGRLHLHPTCGLSEMCFATFA